MSTQRLAHAALLLATIAGVSPAFAQLSGPSMSGCAALPDAVARLACYDQLAGRASRAIPAPALASPAPAPATQPPPRRVAGQGMEQQGFVQRWELEPASKGGTFRIQEYESVYILPLTWRRALNTSPCSLNPVNCFDPPRPDQGYKNNEVKFQLSFKTKLWQDMLGTQLDWWAGYTQQSYWQLYDGANSRPFRESDYQPETWVTVPLKLGSPGLQLRMLNLGISHQSNGQTDPLSRSWNRLYAAFGFTSGNLSMTVKPWWRIREGMPSDNNPHIEDYVGRVEVQAAMPVLGSFVSARLRNNLRFGGTTPNRSYVQLDWAFPMRDNLYGHVQFFDGWGNSLQNYNFRNTGIGLGVSLVEWR